MRYLGGKSKIRKQVAAFLESVRETNQPYLEPFVGGGWILQEVGGDRTASDGNKALIAMYQALQDGWVPPEFVSEEEYADCNRLRDASDPMTAFCGFGVSFAGKWFGGYARSEGKTCYAATTKRSLLKQLPHIADVKFESKMYQEHTPEGMLVYCDPPYAGTTQYGAFDGFDHDEFWVKMREWAKANTVVVSEYTAPDDWVCIKEMSSQMGLSSEGGARTKRVERMFMHESSAYVQGLSLI